MQRMQDTPLTDMGKVQMKAPRGPLAGGGLVKCRILVPGVLSSISDNIRRSRSQRKTRLKEEYIVSLIKPGTIGIPSRTSIT